MSEPAAPSLGRTGAWPSRRDLLKAGGALIVGFSFAGQATAAPAAAAARGTLAGPPDPQRIDTWLAIHADNSATLYFGKCELGQGNTTGLLQIAGEELDLAVAQMSAVRLDTNVTPDQHATSSSSSIERGGPQVRAAAAQARQALLLRASQKLGVQVGSLVVANGVVSIDGEPNRSVTYGELIGGKPFAIKFTGTAPRKPPSQYRLVGTRVPRVDIPDKVAAKYVHMQHVRVPDMLHGRVVRPRGQRAYGSGAKVASLDANSIAHIPGARVVRRGEFVGVVAEREWDAIRAAKDLKIAWQDPPPLPDQSHLPSVLRDAQSTDTVVVNVGNVDAGFAGAAHVASAEYFSPYQAHAVFGPNCALADVKADSALVRSSTQDVYASRKMLAALLGMPDERVRVQYYEGSGTYGHSCYEDAPQAAAILSQAVGRPVRVQFMRWDELGWDNYGPAQVAKVRAATDGDGTIVAYTYDGWQHGWHIDETSTELALQKPPAERSAGSFSIIVNRMSTGSMYRIPNRRVTSHAVPMLGLLKGFAAAVAARHGAVVRLGADHRRARLRGEDGSVRVPPQKHGRHAVARRPRSRRQGGGLGSGAGRVAAVPCASRYRPRHRGRHSSRVVRRRRRRDRSRHALRCDRRQAALRRARLRLGSQSGAGREPDRRHAGAGDEPHAQGGSDVRQQWRHQPRLGELSGAALCRTSGLHADRGAADRRTVERRRRRSDGRGGRRHRQRVLRRHRRAAPPISADAAARARRAGGSQERVKLRRIAIARSPEGTTKQSRVGAPSPGLLRFARDDERS
jgi:CO/xanthine dehydrogenase Mo-binding subunit